MLFVRALVIARALAVFTAIPLVAKSQSADIAGTVTGPHGPEAGVWVIAQTTDLPTKYAKIVVTDDRGRYLIPALPSATYDVWVRGYGLVDSPKKKSTPGKTVDLTAVPAPTPRAAAEYFPAGYWYSLIKPPAPSEFPGTGETGNGINPDIKSQAEWLRLMKSGGCTACHQLGTKGTREIPAALGHFDSPTAAWGRRILSGQAGTDMSRAIAQLGAKRATEMFADWTTRIANGEVPPTPPRPKGIERNVVITAWDWADRKAYMHDEASTDRRHTTVNANSPRLHRAEPAADPHARANTVPETPFDADHCSLRTGERSLERHASAPMYDEIRVPKTRRKRDPRIHPRSFIRSRTRDASSRCTTRKPGSSRTSAPASPRTT
jgi:hypothetical protein